MSRRAVILSAVPVSTALCRYVQPGDFVVACDAGYRNAERLDLRPDLIVGDFDSAPQPKTEHETIVLPHVKDDTDTQYAAHWLLEHGYDEITLLGALGGARLEHTLANLATGLYLAKNGVNVLLANERSELRYLVPGRELILQRRDWKYLSLFPMEGQLTGVVNDVIFKGVHFEMHVDCEGREWLIHSTRACTPGETIGMRIGPNEIHIMARSEG